MGFIQHTTNLFLLWLLVFASAGMVGASVYFHSTIDGVAADNSEQTMALDEMEQRLHDTEAMLIHKDKTIKDLEQRQIELQSIYASTVQEKDKMARKQADSRPRRAVWSSRFMTPGTAV